MGQANQTQHRAVSAEEHANFCAYNAVFGELGLRFRWDEDTYSSLAARTSDEKALIAAYLADHQSHLLKAYDAEFLTQLIYDKKNEHYQRFGQLSA